MSGGGEGPAAAAAAGWKVPAGLQPGSRTRRPRRAPRAPRAASRRHFLSRAGNPRRAPAPPPPPARPPVATALATGRRRPAAPRPPGARSRAPLSGSKSRAGRVGAPRGAGSPEVGSDGVTLLSRAAARGLRLAVPTAGHRHPRRPGAAGPLRASRRPRSHSRTEARGRQRPACVLKQSCSHSQTRSHVSHRAPSHIPPDTRILTRPLAPTRARIHAAAGGAGRGLLTEGLLPPPGSRVRTGHLLWFALGAQSSQLASCPRPEILPPKRPPLPFLHPRPSGQWGLQSQGTPISSEALALCPRVIESPRPSKIAPGRAGPTKKGSNGGRGPTRQRGRPCRSSQSPLRTRGAFHLSLLWAVYKGP